jgi:hypothetical protein
MIEVMTQLEAQYSDPESSSLIKDYVMANIKAGIPAMEVLTKLKAEYADEPSEDLIKDFIIKGSDAGMSGIEILASLKAQYADTASGELIDWAQVEEEIKKWVDMELVDPAKLKNDLATGIGAGPDGIVSFPGNIVFNDLSPADRAKADIVAKFADLGITIDFPGFEEKVSETIGNVQGAFDGLGGYMQYWEDEHGVIQTTWIADGSQIVETAETSKAAIDDLDKKALETKEGIEAALKYRAEVDIAKFEADTKDLEIKAELLSEALKFKAEIEIANLENVGKAFDTLSIGLQSSAEIITSSISELADIGKAFGPFSEQMRAVLDSITSETENRKKEVDATVELTKAQVAYLEAKTSQLNKGDSLITIEADGLEPEIEAFMWKILDKIQMRAAESMDEFLLGLSA